MLPLATRIQVDAHATERRSTHRHAVGLAVDGPNRAIVDNLSQTGLALQTNAALSIGDTFEIELPLVGTVLATVAWAEDGQFGCELAVPISKAAVSAARLRSPFDAPKLSVSVTGGAAAPVEAPSRYGMAIGVMAAFAAVAAMFVTALLTAPFAVS
ncbi:MAG: PilZ domain-containing protein [Croceibacterium sp.]